MAHEKLIIYGNGQIARMLLHFARSQFDVVAFTVDRSTPRRLKSRGYPWFPSRTLPNIFRRMRTK